MTTTCLWDVIRDRKWAHCGQLAVLHITPELLDPFDVCKDHAGKAIAYVLTQQTFPVQVTAVKED